MDVYKAIEKRRTIRTFKHSVSEEQLRKIISAGTKAPSGDNLQPWEFIIIDEQKIIDQLAELKYQQNRRLPSQTYGAGSSELKQMALNQKKAFQNANIIAVCEPAGRIQEAQSVWLCIENMLLAAVADGLGSGFTTYWGKYKGEVEKILIIPEGYELAAVIKFGVPGEEGFPRDKIPYAPRRPEFSWLHKNRFRRNNHA